MIPISLMWCAKCKRSVSMMQSYRLTVGHGMSINPSAFPGIGVVDMKEDTEAISIECHGESIQILIPVSKMWDFVDAGRKMHLFVSNEGEMLQAPAPRIEDSACIEV